MWANKKHVVEGYDDNTFRPNGACLRRQMATFLYKYDKFINGKG
ncbi:MAG: S-layer homology domain-containing protein [Clostridiales bacterium]|nr:S-layer homology domain-containing protein [Clostridiales bacterium]